MGTGASGMLFCCSDVNNYRATALGRVRGLNLDGKVYIITGASGGMGVPTAAALFEAGASVIIASRSLEKLGKAKQDIINSSRRKDGEEKIKTMKLDMGDYNSIGSFTDDVSKVFQKVDVLINNAGLHPGNKFAAGKYGWERSFQVNFLGPVVLIEKMMPLLQAAPEARIVNLGSLSHIDAPKPIEFSKLPRNADSFGGYDIDYCEAKWLLSAYTQALNDKLSKGNAKIKAVCADPGISPNSAMWDEQPAPMRFMVRVCCVCLTHTTEQAAGTPVFAAVSPYENLVGGGYYTNGCLHPPRADTKDAENWTNISALIKKVLPQDLVPKDLF
uniref:Protochlorophyllide reductase n=1 Tax=Aplanochytrium stocchinoi TaxID=215587 RepID=A0A7S3V2Q2_9STRA|mmetsp:Transcript_12242/g.15198  ORF Transcript_12242/g.15198 Transcript_12242/m.15198 type:complete len:330 (-) Transcript_12242:364-1353(-)|eukprot:CAMPEP_0204823832 /NCGR_PEP_ID=MMETSP1346-20131115/1903_1 /ASSEMBLY_ACC=CAM_ASM_000771 /TAXON_ID=215587 /ORGANISM="Aplanochytrium stocchinoi, Strain GSBS06" /LENGTH=329 /DNA_ID=CAMNT_0051950653 /DNA_START=182 /DNA_END=1171 /DNA_ORIENTATION=+